MASVDGGLAVDAVGRPGQGPEPARHDLAATADADPEGAVVEAREGCVDLLEMLDGTLPKGEVSLLLEDLGSGGGLRAVGHLVGRLDRFADLLGKPGALRGQLAAERLEVANVHPRTLRADDRPRRLPLYSLGVQMEDKGPMATETDPVCGMQVDPTTSELSLEHDGKTYWFCGRGCLLEFRDDPETYLAPDYVPSM